MSLESWGEFVEARKNLERALEIDMKIKDQSIQMWLEISITLGLSFECWGELWKPGSTMSERLALDEKVYGPDNPHLAAYFNNLGGCPSSSREIG